MRRTTPAAIAAALTMALPGPVAASPFGELAPRGARDGVNCLQPTGVPGELSYSPQRGFPGKVVLLRADASGLHAAGTVPAQPYGRCAEVALRPNGAGIAAFYEVNGADEAAMRVVLRDPGAPAWGAPADLIAGSNVVRDHGITAAVADSGAAVFAALSAPSPSSVEVRVFRRAPGGAFGAAETVFSATADSSAEHGTVRSGVTAAGEAVIAWTFRPYEGAPRELWAATAPPGGPFRAPVRIGALRGSFALGVGDGGHALLAFPAGDELRVAERGPGGEFGLATRLGTAGDPYTVNPAVAVRADGAAVVAWAGGVDGALRAAVRGAPGPFSPPSTVVRAAPLGFGRPLLALLAAFGEEDDVGDSVDESGLVAANATIVGERALLTSAGPARYDGVWASAPRVATLPLAGGPAEAHVVGSGLPDAATAIGLVLGGGAPATAWSERVGGLVHLAVEGVADAADEPAPHVRVGAPRRRSLPAGKDLELPVTCSAACTVRASLGDAVFSGGGSLTLQRAGTGTLKLSSELRPVGRLDGGPLRLRLRYGAPRARHATTKTIVVRVRRGRVPPSPRVRAVSARRAGRDVVVTWRTDRAARGDAFLVFGTAERRSSGLRVAEIGGTGRRFRARLRDTPDAKYVTIVTGDAYLSLARRTTVEIQG